MRRLGEILKKIVCIVVFIYVVITFYNQQKILNTYASNNQSLNEQIEEANKYNQELTEKKENASSEEYIEELAREKLDMYLPNERVYINSEN